MASNIEKKSDGRMSSFLRGSPNYVWATTSVLGKGATGAVYQGVNRHTGEPVAVKTFNQLSHMRPREVQVREFEVLKKVKHENIVKLLAIEEEQESRGKVIVMELCTGGSLFNILDDPENTDGLDEHEFLLVLSHLTAGMKHLRDHNLVHRDLKPGNIMKFINLDGSTVYKLTDFGAARELPDDQQFMSLYGTEEYLHPDMYERAVLRKPVGKKFGASVDLWSIGVTLYHVSTGSLPFRPYGGRRNKETMHFITTKKESGVISGAQKSEDGAIEWSEKLPDSCQLSYGLKKLLTPLLAGLLEVDPQKMWSFELFFQEVTNILACRQLSVFHVNRLHMLKVYMRPEDTYSELGCLLLEQTDISPAQQILLYDTGLLLKSVQDDTEGRSYPQATPENPIILLNKDNNNVTLQSEQPLPKFPVMPNAVSVENDAILAKRACSEGYSAKRQTNRLCRIYRLMDKAVNMFSSVISCRVEEVKRRAEQGSALTNALAQQVNALSTSYSALCMVLEKLLPGSQLQERRQALHHLIADRQQTRSALVANMGGLAPSVDQLWNRVVRDGALLSEWRRNDQPSPEKLDLCDRKAQSYVNKLRDSWQHLLRDRAARTMTYNDEQFHMLEKIKIQETGKQLMNLLQSECQPSVAHSADIIADWYKLAQANFVQSVLLEKEIESQEDDLRMFSVDLESAQNDYSKEMTLLAAELRVKSDGPQQNGGVQKNQLRLFLNEIQKMELLQTDILNFAQENTDLVDELQQLTMDLPTAT